MPGLFQEGLPHLQKKMFLTFSVKGIFPTKLLISWGEDDPQGLILLFVLNIGRGRTDREPYGQMNQVKTPKHPQDGDASFFVWEGVAVQRPGKVPVEPTLFFKVARFGFSRSFR